jgi:hypothetical protein
MKKDPKTTYAQSSDIKSRTYLEYRRDMKRKAIAELEAREWIEEKFKEMYPGKKVSVRKSGGDAFLWFLRKGGVTREPDYVAEIGKKKIEIEFQYADREDLSFYDFKVSKVARKVGNKRSPIENKLFVYIHKPLRKYAIFKPDWIIKNGQYGMVEAWRSYAFRVPAERFEKLLRDDESLIPLCEIIEIKNFILEFQHELLALTRQRFSRLFQGVIDKEQLVKIAPRDLESFFRICFILDSMDEVPENAVLWIVYLLSFINQKNTLEDIFKITYCLDFLYSKVELKENELREVIKALGTLMTRLQQCAKDDGSYTSDRNVSPLDETRYALFAINLLEDMTQDAIHYYSVNLLPVRTIYENVPNIENTYNFIRYAP